MRIRPLKLRHHYIIPRPGSHDHAGGGPVAPPGGTHPGGVDVVLDDDTAAYVAAVEAADGQPLEPAVKAATQNLVTGLKDAGAWDAIDQLILTAGPRTAAGAKIPLRGTVHCEFDETKATHVRAFGFRAKPGSGWYIDSKIAASSLTLNNASLGAYFMEWQPTRTTYAFGSSAIVNGGCCLAVQNDSLVTSGSGTHVHGCFQSDGADAQGAVNVGRHDYYFVRLESQRATIVARATATLMTPTTNNNVAGTIRIGSAPPAGPDESVEAYIPHYIINRTGSFSVLTLTNLFREWRTAIQSAVPPTAPPAVPVFSPGWEPFHYAEAGGVYFWLDRDDSTAAEYRVYVNGTMIPAAALNWDGLRSGLCSVTPATAAIGSTVEVAAWNGAGETRAAPVVIASRNPP